jgi:voltage-gated potassium channel Kch
MPTFFLIFTKFFKIMRDGMRDPEFRTLAISVLFVLLCGTFFYHGVEGWSWLDSFYFSVITLTTIGYGDLSPSTPGSKIFTIFFIFIGLGVFSAFIILVADRYMKIAEAKKKLLQEKKDAKS